MLESSAIGKDTESNYFALASAFMRYCQILQLNWSDALTFDQVLVEYLNYMHLEGESAEQGTKAVSALQHYLPQTAKGGEWKIPRAIRCLKGWRKLMPAVMRLPLPRAAAFAIAGVMMSRGKNRMAGWVILAFICYLRPHECMALLAGHLVPPVAAAGTAYCSWGLLLHDADLGRAGKTGLLDDSVLVDVDLFVHALMTWLRAGLQSHESLWNFTMAELCATFTEIALLLGLRCLNTTLYGLRHGGVSHDLLHHRRTVEVAQRRGRWKAASSMRRYAKETRLLKEMGKVPRQVFEFGNDVENKLPELLKHGLQAGVVEALLALVRGAVPL